MAAPVVLAVIDDDETVRETNADMLSEKFEPRPLAGPFSSLEELVQRTRQTAEAAICDYQLKTHTFAPCTGAEVVAELYRAKFPAVLMTRFKRSDAEAIRPLRPYIAVVLDPKHFDPETVADALQACQEEFEGNPRPTRKAWRTKVDIDDTDAVGGKTFVKAILPGWRPDEGIKFPMSIVPEKLHSKIEPGGHLYAYVNTGAESQDDLFLRDFEAG